MNELDLLGKIGREFEYANACFNDAGSCYAGMVHFLHAWHGIYLLQQPNNQCSFNAFLSKPITPTNPGVKSHQWMQALNALQCAKSKFLESEWHELEKPETDPGFLEANRILGKALRRTRIQTKRKHRIGFYNPKLRVSIVAILAIFGLFLLGSELKKMLVPRAFAVLVFDNVNFDGTPTESREGSLDFVNTASIAGQSLRTHFSLRATACVKVKEASTLSMAVTSDDGSRVLIDGNTIINNWGVHAMVRKEGSKELSVGIHEVVIEFYQGGGPGGLKIEGNLMLPNGKSSSFYDVFYAPRKKSGTCR